jgi:hypothetical protein
MGLRVDYIDVEGTNLRFGKDLRDISMPSPAKFVAQVIEADLSAFLEQRQPAGLKNFHVTVADGKMRIEATKAMIIELPARATCRLRIEDGQRLVIDLEEVIILGAGAKNLVQSQLDKINPVLDVADLPVAALLDTVDAGDGVLTLKGSIAPKVN